MPELPHNRQGPWLADLSGRGSGSTWNSVPDTAADGAAERWLAGIMAHEVNNHLAAALMELELAADGSHSPEVNGLLDRLSVAIGSAGEVCRSTLGLLRPEPSAVAAPGLVADAVKRAVQCVGRLRSRVRVEVVAEAQAAATPLPLIRMQQVVLNLLLNALRASSGAVVVEVRVQHSRRKRAAVAGSNRSTWNDRALSSGDGTPGLAVIVTVTDSGPGLPPDVARRLVAPVSAGSTRRVAEGGFGLSAVRHLVAMAGGSIATERAEGGGAMVVLTLPAVASGIGRLAA